MADSSRRWRANNSGGVRARPCVCMCVELGPKRMLAHASASTSTTASLLLPLLARSCLPLYQRCSLKAGTPSIFTDLKFLCLSPTPPQPLERRKEKKRRGRKKTNLPVFPSAHTYIHKHVFMKARSKRAGAAGGGGGRGWG